MNGTQAIEATSQSNCPKKHFDPLFGHPKDIATETGDTHVRDTALPSCKFSRQSGRDICSEAKIVIFPYMGFPGGGGYPLPSHAIHSRKLPSS